MATKYNHKDGEALVKAQIASGLSGSAYCREHGISYDALKYWCRKLGYSKPQRRKQNTAEKWARIEHITEADQECTTGQSITVSISNIRVEIPSGSTRKDITQVLGAVLEIC